MKNANPDNQFWLEPDFRADELLFNRTAALRWRQSKEDHRPCFGVDRSKPFHPQTPDNCGEPNCPMRRACVGLHERELHPDHLREQSLEILSSAYLLSRLMEQARAGERKLNRRSAFEQRAAQLIQAWDGDVPQAAFVGAFSSGKTTLLNRVLGLGFLPTRLTPTTATPTNLEYGAHPHALVNFRRFLRQGVLREDGRGVDVDGVKGLLGLFEGPAEIERIELRKAGKVKGISRKTAIKECSSLLSKSAVERSNSRIQKAGRARRFGRGFRELRRRLGEVPAERTFEIRFAPREALILNLEDREDEQRLASYLANAAYALQAESVVCQLPVPLLRGLTLVDTAGLCSPTGFHETATQRLIDRHPDEIVVVLRATDIHKRTTRRAIESAWRVAAGEEELHDTRFVLTHWDSRLSGHRLREDEDVEGELSPEEFADVDKMLRTRARAQLKELLVADFDWPSDVMPTCYFVGLGEQTTDELFLADLESLKGDLVRSAEGQGGVDLWQRRWRDEASVLDALEDERLNVIDGLAQALEDLDAGDSARRRKALETDRESIKKAIQRISSNIRAGVQNEKVAVLQGIESLQSSKEIKTYLEEGYWEAVNAALNNVQATTREYAKEVAALVEPDRPKRVTNLLGVVSLDRRLLGLSKSTRQGARGKVTGVTYALAYVWDAIFGSVPGLEINESRRENARELLRRATENSFEIIVREAEKWITKLDNVRKDALRRIKSRLGNLDQQAERRNDIRDTFNRRTGFVNNLKSQVDSVRRDLESLQLAMGHRAGERLTGRVTNLTDYGAFVDIGGVDGLLHVSEIALRRLEAPSQLLSPGERVEVLVKSISDDGKVSLTRLPLVFEEFVERHPVGTRLRGTVTSVTDFGAFFLVDPVIEGLVHISELSEGYVEDPRKVVAPGDEHELVIVEIDPSKKQISLSLKQAVSQ